MSYLQNIGTNRGFTYGAIKRFIFTKTTTDGGTANRILISAADTLANWQALFNVHKTDADPSTKYMPSPLVRAVGKEDTEPVFFELEDYRTKMRNAYADINFTLLDMEPYIYGNMRNLEDEVVSVFMVGENGEMIGKKNGLYLEPIPIKLGSFNVPFYPFRSFEAASQGVGSFRLGAGTDLDSIVAVTLTSGDVFDSLDFYSLIDVSGAVTDPAVTGCDIILTVDDTDANAPGDEIYLTDTDVAFGDITFTDQDGVSGDVTLAASGSLSYNSTTKKHTINEAALLTTGHTYTCKIPIDKYDITVADVVIP